MDARKFLIERGISDTTLMGNNVHAHQLSELLEKYANAVAKKRAHNTIGYYVNDTKRRKYIAAAISGIVCSAITTIVLSII